MVRNKLFMLFRIHTVLPLLLLLTCGSTSALAGVTTMLRFPELNIRAGKSVQVKAYFNNEGEDSIEFTFPDSLSIRIKSPDGESVIATAVETGASSNVTLQPKEFVTKEYNVVIPQLYYGQQEISLADSPETGLLLNIMDEKQEIPVDGKTIEVVPVTEWLISKR